MPKKVDPKAKNLGIKKLESSGLTSNDAKLLHIDLLSGAQTSKLHKSFKTLASLKINYFNHERKPCIDWDKSSPFYRIRYLETPPDFAQITKKKPLRYVQEPNTAPVAYYPQNFDDWEDLCQDPDQPLIITEGELKAAKACKEGFPTIGLGGVYNWRSYKLGLEWLPSLECVEWRKRNVYICFDSDYRDNPLVCSALKHFATELQRRGSFAYLVSLPQLPGLEKVGLDDFLVHAGPSATEMFHELLTNAEPLGLTAPLWEFNNNYCYIRNPGFIIDQRDLENKVSSAAFKEHLEAPVQYQERQIKADGSISFKSVSAAAHWLKWPLRTEAAKITYDPGRERFITNSLTLFNTWPGWGCEAKKGDIDPFLKLVDHIFTGTTNDAKQWFLRWCAYPLQYPGVKMFSSVVVHGIKHGTGKSLIGYTLAKIYGKNFTELSQLDIHNRFNEWAENKQFVLGDDVTGSDKRADNDFLKKMITQSELRLNPKHIRSYVVPDCINYYFTSNHPDAFFIEDNDRRYFIHEVLVDPLPEEFYVEYQLWLDSIGPPAVFDYLLKLNLGDFNPAAPAYVTTAKDRMIDTGRSDLASWVRNLVAVPEAVLKIGDVTLKQDLFTSAELLNLYDPHQSTRTTANGLARELKRAGIRQVYEGKPIKLNGTQGRYFIIRNPKIWEDSPYSQIIKHLTPQKKAKKY